MGTQKQKAPPRRCAEEGCSEILLTKSNYCPEHRIGHPFSTDLGTALRPISMRHLSELLGVSESMLRKVARGVRRPNDLIKDGIREHLGLDWREVFPQQPSENDDVR